MKNTMSFVLGILLLLTLWGCENAEAPEVITTAEPESNLEEVAESSGSEIQAEPVNISYTKSCYFMKVFHGKWNALNQANQGTVILSTVEELQTVPYYLEAGVVNFFDYSTMHSVENSPEIGFDEICTQKYNEDYFEKKDLLLFLVEIRSNEVRYEPTEFTHDPVTGQSILRVLCHQPQDIEEEYSKMLLFALDVEKGALPKEYLPGIELEVAYNKHGNCYFSGPYGVQLETDRYEGVQSLCDTWHWGVRVMVDQWIVDGDVTKHACYAEVAYWKDGFFLDPAIRVEEIATHDGNNVRVGYDFKGDWLWVDFMHPTGKYAAMNYGVTGIEAINLLEVVLTAELGN